MVNSAYRGDGSKKGWTTEADLIDGIRTNETMMEEMMNTPDSVIFKKVGEDGAIEGCVYLQEKKDRLYLGLLTVSPIIQSKGFGKQLLALAEEYARMNAKPVIYMTVISIRQELIDWYERHGYKRTGKAVPFPDASELIRPRQPLILLTFEKLIS